MATYMRAQISKSPLPHRRSTQISLLITAVLLVVFLIGGGYLGYVFYETVKDVVAHAELPTLPYIDSTLPVVNPVARDYPNPRASGNPQPVTSLAGEELPDWEEAERVNILLVGIDQRPDEYISRTDTMILVTVDPSSRTAGMLSIPRDLWVTIPGYGENRVNLAHYLGEKDDYPGGGPALAMKTVQYNLGVPVHFYVRADFNGFRRIVDTLGGIEIDIPQTIDDPKYPDQNYGYDPFYMAAGRQYLDGETALKYARTRATADSDFDRARRQQLVLLAIREKALAVGMIPKIPELWTTMADTVETDLQLVDILELAKLADVVAGEDILTVVIDRSMTLDFRTETGAQVLLPIREQIRPVVDEMFSAQAPKKPAAMPTPTVDPAAVAEHKAAVEAENQRQAEMAAVLQEEGASIVVQNGTGLVGLDSSVAEYLRNQGFNVLQFGPADRADYPRTVIVDYTNDKPYALEALATIFNVADENIRHSPNLKSDVDIRVIVGTDFEMPEARLLDVETAPAEAEAAPEPFIQPTRSQ